LLAAAVVRGKLDLELVPVKDYLQTSPEPQLNTAAVEMVTTQLERQEPQGLALEVMALQR
jgi:hypothetical protein